MDRQNVCPPQLLPQMSTMTSRAMVVSASLWVVASACGDTDGKTEDACGAALEYHGCVLEHDESGAPARGGDSACTSPSKHGDGISSGWAHAKSTVLSGGEFAVLEAVYTVPAEPELPCDQTLYYFVGLQDPLDPAGTSIVQSVLGWNKGEGGWFLTSEDCCIPNNQLSHPIAVRPGDEIRGSIVKSGDNIVITTATGSDATVLTTASGGRRFTEAVAALEVYKLEACGEQPASEDFVFEIRTLEDQTGRAVTTPWEVKTDLDSCPGNVSVRR